MGNSAGARVDALSRLRFADVLHVFAFVGVSFASRDDARRSSIHRGFAFADALQLVIEVR